MSVNSPSSALPSHMRPKETFAGVTIGFWLGGYICNFGSAEFTRTKRHAVKKKQNKELILAEKFQQKELVNFYLLNYRYDKKHICFHHRNP